MLDSMVEDISGQVADSVSVSGGDDHRAEIEDSPAQLRLEESSIFEHEDLKSILIHHEVLDLPIPDAVIPLVRSELSTIVEEKDTDQSVTAGTSKIEYERGLVVQSRVVEEGHSSAPSEEEEEHQQIEPKEEEEHLQIETENGEEKQKPAKGEEAISMSVSEDIEPTCDSKVDTLDVAAIDQEVFEPKETSFEEDATVKQKRGRRGKSARLSQVPLPFSSRRSVWDGDRDRSPSGSVTSEPPLSMEEAGKPRYSVVTPTRRRSARNTSPSSVTSEPAPYLEQVSKPRLRRHSITSTTTSSPVRRRSTRLSTSVMNDAVTAVTQETPTTPSKNITMRRSRGNARTVSTLEEEEVKDDVVKEDDIVKEEMGESYFLPSAEASPTDSCYSGRSSATGTPMRRSARIALRERTPEPSIATDLLISSLSRIRRHSAGPTDTVSPLRRSGRKSANISRDSSPVDSVTSEPPLRTEVTPSRKKTPRASIKSIPKSVALNLFPVEEESELSDVGELFRPSSSKTAKLQMSLVESDESDAQNEEKLEGVKKTGKSRSQSSASSPGSGRYNLRRKQNPELDIISEEDAHADAAASKRRRDDPSEESSDTTNVGDAPQESSPKRLTKTKRRKKTEETDSASGIGF